ncbi:methyl-accepting chemotaxis protein [Halomonas shantousis]
MGKTFNKISVKYAIAFIGVALALLIIVTTDFFLINSVKQRMAEFANTFNKATSAVLNADRDLYQARVAELEYLRTTPDSDKSADILEDYRENARQAHDGMQTFLDKLSAYPEITSEFTNFETLYNNWTTQSERVFSLYENGDRTAAIAQLEGNSLTAFESLRGLYNTAGEAADIKILALETATLERIRTRQSIVAIFAALVFIAAVVIALVGPLFMSRAIRRITQRIKEITEGDGDLTARIDNSRSDEIGELAIQFNAFIERIDTTLQSVRTSTQSVNKAADEIARGSQELAARTEQAASSLQETSASMEEIAATVSNTSEAAQQANQLVQSTVDVVRHGHQAMRQVENTMDEITASSQQISEIISLIDGIAFQTNILALNASVEAARAGEHGRGFAVVAQEVRTLASRSSDASRDIRELIDTSVSRTQYGAKLVKETGRTMQEIVDSIARVTDVIGEISAGAREQNLGIAQVNTAVTELDTMTQHNAALVEESNNAAGGMREQAASLSALIASFRLSHTETASLPASAARQPAASVSSTSPSPRKPLAKSPVSEWEVF